MTVLDATAPLRASTSSDELLSATASPTPSSGDASPRGASDAASDSTGDGDLAPVEGSFHGINLAAFHPRLVPAIPPPAAFEASPHWPVVVVPSPFAAAQQQVFKDQGSPTDNLLGVNSHPMEFESDLLKGKVEVHIRGVKNSQAAKFEGKKRYVHVAMQARFKRPTVSGDFCIGQEMFGESVVPVWLSEALLSTAARVFSSTTRVSARSRPRYFMNPALACCQLVNVSRPGEEPGLWDAQEDVRLMLPRAVTSSGAPLAAEARRKWCDVPANIAGTEFNNEFVYTFHFYQQYADFARYRLSIGFLNVDLAPLLHRSPLQLTAKDVGSGLYGFSLLVWNERSLYGCAQASAEAAAKAAESQLKAGGGFGSRLLSGVRSVFGSGAAP